MENNINDFSIMFTIGPISIPWYGFLLSLGFLFFCFFSYVEWRKKEYHWFDFFNIIFVGVFVALFGARWWYLIFNPKDIDSVFSFFQISNGRSILGSIFFCFVWLKFYTWKFANYIEFRRAFSLMFPNLLLAQAIGRWGNFFEQDVYGMVANNDLIFLPEYIREGMFINGEYRQPLFLYESIINLFGWVLITFSLKNISQLKPGTHGASYLIWYGVTRASMELYRDELFIMKIGNVPTSFILSIIIILVGVVLFVYYQFYFINININLTFNKNEYFKFIKDNLLLSSSRLFLRIELNEYKLNKKILKLNYEKNFCEKIDLNTIDYMKNLNKSY